jgi:hypothetical protein
VRALALRTLEAKLWLPGPGQYAFAILEQGAVNENLTSWPATAMSFDVFDAERGAAMAARLASTEIMTDWGARPLSAKSTLFDPLHYNNGAVWPFVTGWVALAQYRYHNAHAGRFALEAIARTGFDESRGRNPEVISGRVYKPLDTSVPHQFFATSMVITPLVRGLLGIDVDAPAGRLTVAPSLPPDWDSVRVEHLPVGTARLTLAVRRRGRSLILDVQREGIERGTPISVVFSPAIPLGASNVRSRSGASGEEALVKPAPFPGAIVVGARATLGDADTAIVSWEGGWEVVPPRQVPRIGDRSSALRVISERVDDAGRFVLRLEGRAGSTYVLRARGPGGTPRAVTVLPPEAPMGPLELSEADAEGWVTLRIAFPAQGGDADGYVALGLVFESR